jgi:hypothetical protein
VSSSFLLEKSMKQSYQEFRQKNNDSQRYIRYGITGEEYRAMLVAQNGICACCGGTEPIIDSRTGNARQLATDHNHATGKVARLLCSSCNIALGHMQHEVRRIELLLAYCKEHYGDENVREPN